MYELFFIILFKLLTIVLQIYSILRLRLQANGYFYF